MQRIVKYKKYTVIFCIGAIGYGCIEILWRGHTHWSMLLAGGTCFVLFSLIEKRFRSAHLLYKCIIASAAVTGIEFVFGCIFNLLLHKNVWDYSHLPMNLGGQICLLYSVLWGILGAIFIPIAGALSRSLQNAEKA